MGVPAAVADHIINRVNKPANDEIAKALIAQYLDQYSVIIGIFSRLERYDPNRGGSKEIPQLEKHKSDAIAETVPRRCAK